MKTPISRRDFLKISTLMGGASLLSRKFNQPRRKPSNPEAPNIILLVLDTLSARNMSLYGYPRRTTPQLERWAKQAMVYQRHYAGGNFTTPGTASLLTGTYPWTHRALHLYGRVRSHLAGHNLFSQLKTAYPHQIAYTHNPLAQILLEQYQAAGANINIVPTRQLAISDDRLSEHLSADFSHAFWGEKIIRQIDNRSRPATLFLSVLDYFYQLARFVNIQGSHTAQFPRGVPSNKLGAYFLLADAIDWIARLPDEMPTPYLAYVHLFPPHEPYTPRSEFIDCFEDNPWQANPKPTHAFAETGMTEAFLQAQRRQYDEYIADVDAEIGRLLTNLEQNNALENTFVILTSDHGQLFERGIHGHETPVLFEPLIHIPLLIWNPAQKTGRSISTPTSAVDILPTLLYLAGQPQPTWTEGQILPGFEGDSSANTARSIFAVEAKESGKFSTLTPATVAMISGTHKIIKYTGYSAVKEQLIYYDLESDPGERQKLPLNSLEAQQMQAELDARLTPFLSLPK